MRGGCLQNGVLLFTDNVLIGAYFIGDLNGEFCIEPEAVLLPARLFARGACATLGMVADDMDVVVVRSRAVGHWLRASTV